MLTLVEHHERRNLLAEAHARPSFPIQGIYSVAHLALLIAADRRNEEFAWLEGLLADNPNALIEHATPSHRLIQAGSWTLKWEKHGEFSDFTFYCPKDGGDYHRPIDTIEDERLQPPTNLPWTWINRLPGALIAACHLLVLPAQVMPIAQQIRALSQAPEPPIAAYLADGEAAVFTHFREYQGWTRMIVINEQLAAWRLGRTILRLIEIETYRLMALLTHPLAKNINTLLNDTEQRLAKLMDQQTHPSLPDHQLLNDLTALAVTVENSIAESDFRFGAGKAYFDLVLQRTQALKEKAISGFSSIGGFMERRLRPAMATCAAVHHRQISMSHRIGRATELLRTRVNVTLERQNQELLLQMNRRAQIQLRLQETVEGLSVVVISYYGSQLIHYLVKGLEHAFVLPFSAETATAVSIPLIAIALFLSTRRLKGGSKNPSF